MAINWLLGSQVGIDSMSTTVGEGTVAPRLQSAVATSAGTVLVTFSRDMFNEHDSPSELPLPIFDPYNYLIREYGTDTVLRVTRVKKISDTQFELRTHEQTEGTTYSLEVINLYDDYGTPVDPSYDTVYFAGKGMGYEVEVDEMFLFPGAYMGMGGFTVPDFIPDQDPPFITNLDPYDGESQVVRVSNIQFDLLDVKTGVDPDSVTITVNGVDALVAGVQQPGYSVNQLVITSGFRYTINPDEGLPEGELITIGVSSQDQAYLPIEMSVEYSFSTASTPPVLLNRNPGPGDDDVHPNRSIYFEVVDLDGNVNFSSVVITVNGTVAFQNGVIRNQHRVGWTTVSNGYAFRVYAPDQLPIGTNTVAVVADNTATYSATMNASYQFEVQELLALDSKTAWNQFDEHGLALATKRLRGESNHEYKRRLMNVMVDIANSTYRGLTNGITRELGLSLFKPMFIQPRVDSSGAFLAPDPYILFDGVWLYLYSDYKNGLLDYKFDRFQPGGNFEHLGRLCDYIENNSYYFAAGLLGTTDRLTRSMTVLNQSNRMAVDSEDVQPSTRSALAHQYIIPGTVEFDNRLVFKRRVSSVNAISRQGDWHLNYQKGILTTASVPPRGTKVRYKYTAYPFHPIASPVILNDINNDNFRVKMFKEILQEGGSSTYGVPTELGVDIINELLTVVPMYWGM